MAADPDSVMTLEEYRVFERSGDVRHEFVDGRVRLMSGGTRNHAILSVDIAAMLATHLGDGPCNLYNSDMRVRLNEWTQVYPDVSVSCDERDKGNNVDDEIAYPLLVVEVLSPGTERIDRGRKLRDYQACPSFQEYVLVGVEHQAVEVYRRGGDGWSDHRDENGIEVHLASIDARLSLAAMYRRTSVPVDPPS